jgi:hypothetical protein
MRILEDVADARGDFPVPFPGDEAGDGGDGQLSADAEEGVDLIALIDFDTFDIAVIVMAKEPFQLFV